MFGNLFYDSYHFCFHLSKQQVNTIRRTLLTSCYHKPVNDYYTSGIRILIINPPLSSKCRNIGSIRKTKESSYQVFRFSYQFRTSYSQHSASNADFKSLYGLELCSGQAGFADAPILMKVSASYKKLSHIQCIQSSVEKTKDSSIPTQMFIPSTIEKPIASEQFRKRDESKEIKLRIKKAANYLIRLGKELKSGKSSEKTIDGRTLESSENEIKIRIKKLLINRHSRDVTKHYDKLKSPQEESNQKKSKINKEELHITESMSSGLSFVKRMESLAMNRVIK